MARLMELAAAREKILDFVSPLTPTTVSLSAVCDLVLAEDVRSDIDSPPFDKSLMDGYAVNARDASHGTTLTIVAEVLAGEVPGHSVGPGSAVKIMTGAPLPSGADAVVMREETERIGDQMRITAAKVIPEQNILRRASCLARGDRVLLRGHRLRGQEIGLLAEVGCATPTVIPQPRIAILPTGDELVGVDVPPSAGQIRNSNGPMLAALVTTHGGQAVSLGIGADQPQRLAAVLRQGLTYDALVVCGGVSAGDRDLVPEALTSLGVAKVFHKVNLKPGKPMWFGTYSVDQITRPVFGLPGNPVSSLVCFLLFVRPAMHRMLGRTEVDWNGDRGHLTVAHRHRGGRLTYFPAQAIRVADGTVEVTPLNWKGSADLRTFADANCLMELPGGSRNYLSGEPVTVYWI